MNVNDLTPWFELLTGVAAIGAVVIGGIWTAYTFRVLKLKERAQTDLDQAQKLAEGLSVVDAKIDVEFLEAHSRFECPIRITATVTNIGSRNTVLSFDDTPVIVDELLLQGGIVPCVMRSYPFSHLDIPEIAKGDRYDVLTLRSGATDTFEFLIGLIRPGLYRAKFSTFLSKSEEEVARKAGMDFGEEGLEWSDERVFHVPNTHVAPWTGLETAETYDSVVTQLTDHAIQLGNLIEELADDDTNKTELNDRLDSILNLRSALVVGDIDTVTLLFGFLEKDLEVLFGPEVLDEIRMCIDHANELAS